MEFLQHPQVGLLGLGTDVVVQQAVHQQADGVHGARRHGGVAALALAAQHGGAVLPRFLGDALGALDGVRRHPHRAESPVGHGVAGHAALEVQDHAVFQLGAYDLAVEAALLPVADRELGVRRKAERRHGVMRGVVVHVVHIGLFVGTQQRAHRVFELDAAVLEVFQRIQAEDAGAFVVRHAAAQEPAVPDADGVGIGVPAVALGHHVGVGDGRQILLPVGDGAGLGPADVALGVIRFKAQLGGDLQRLVQRGPRPRSERRARFRRALHTWHRHQAGDVTQNIVAVLLRKSVDGRPTWIVHKS